MSERQAQSIRFGKFLLDLPARQLWCGEKRVHLNPRYFDALVVLASHPGRVITRQQFFDEVWAPQVVGDEALSQCIAALRRALSDDASNPRFIRTVPRRGYEFLVVESAPETPRGIRWVAGAGLGGALAGLLGGFMYGAGFAFGTATAQFPSTLAVMVVVNVAVGALAALGPGAGFATGVALRDGVVAPIVGAALGGLVVGAAVRWLSSEAFLVLFGLAVVPGTGAVEGAAIGGALGAGLVLGRGGTAARMMICAVVVALAAVLVVAAGGHLMGGSLELLAREAGGSQLAFDHFGYWLGSDGFGLSARLILAAFEGAFLGAGVAWGIAPATRWQPALTSAQET